MLVPSVVLESPQSVLNFISQGGNVVCITEDDMEDFTNYPKVIKASILLPPYEAISAEIDGNMDTATAYYFQWLSQKDCMDYINLIVLALMQGIPIGIYFGSEKDSFSYPMSFLNFVSGCTGIVFGREGGIQSGYLDERFIPNNVCNLFMNGLIDPQTFIMMMPVDTDIQPQVLQYLIQVFHPWLPANSTMGDYNNHFKNIISESRKAGKYLYCPIVGD